MKKLLISTICLLSVYANAQMQMYDNNSSTTSGTNQSLGIDKSNTAFNIMINAFEKADLNGDKSLFYINTLGDSETCVYLTAAGGIIKPQDIRENIRIGFINETSPRKNSNEEISKKLIILSNKLIIMMTLATITEQSWAEIQSKRMNESAATAYIAAQIGNRYTPVEETIIATLKSEAPRMRVFFNTQKASPLGGVGNPACFSQVAPGAQTPDFFVNYGVLSSWRLMAGDGRYEMTYSDGKLTIYKNNQEWISGSKINGQQLTLSTSKKKESGNNSSTSRSKTTTQ
jgi:hypothetical protein